MAVDFSPSRTEVYSDGKNTNTTYHPAEWHILARVDGVQVQGSLGYRPGVAGQQCLIEYGYGRLSGTPYLKSVAPQSDRF